MYLLRFVSDQFLWVILLISGLSVVFPEMFLWVSPHIIWMLGVIMFGMGATTDARDFSTVVENKWLVLLGVTAQFTIMPLLALGISAAFGLENQYAYEIIVIGCCPGGTASNVIVYLARGNVPLSISMTLVSTLLAPLVTPAIIYWLLSAEVQLSFWQLMKTPLIVVLIPVISGIILRLWLKTYIEKVKPVFPAVSVIGISLIVAGLLAANHDSLAMTPLIVAGAVVLHNLLGLVIGYALAILIGANSVNAKTIAIEVGMQNSGLGAVIAKSASFQALTGVPSAIFSVWHNVSGSILARVRLRK